MATLANGTWVATQAGPGMSNTVTGCPTCGWKASFSLRSDAEAAADAHRCDETMLRLEAEAVDEDRRCGCGRLVRFDADLCDACTDQDTRTFGEPA